MKRDTQAFDFSCSLTTMYTAGRMMSNLCRLTVCGRGGFVVMINVSIIGFP